MLRVSILALGFKGHPRVWVTLLTLTHMLGLCYPLNQPLSVTAFSKPPTKFHQAMLMNIMNHYCHGLGGITRGLCKYTRLFSPG